LDENFTRLITTFDEVRHFFHARTCTLQVLHLKSACRRHKNSVRPRNVRPPKSLPATSSRTSFDLLKKAARRDSAVHVSLSSDSLVKQPGTGWAPLSGKPESRRSFQLPMSIGSFGSPNISEVLRRRDIAPRADDAPYGFYIVLRRVGCQHLIPKPAARKSPPRSSLMATRRSSPRREPVYSLHGGRPKGAESGESGESGERRETFAGARPRRTAATFLGRSLGSGGRCQFGGLCARVASSVTRPALPEIG
jgi:hypothetical protein